MAVGRGNAVSFDGFYFHIICKMLSGVFVFPVFLDEAVREGKKRSDFTPDFVVSLTEGMRHN